MGMAENSKCWGQKGKQPKINFAKSGTKHFIRSHNKNTENVIFQTCDEDISVLGKMLGITAESRKKGK